MAMAALEILGLTSRVAQALDPVDFVPMVGQGCVAVEHRFGDARVAAMVALVDHPDTRFAVETERAFLSVLGSGCSLPVGAHVDATGMLTTFLASGDEPGANSVLMQADVTERDSAAMIAAQLARMSRERAGGR